MDTNPYRRVTGTRTAPQNNGNEDAASQLREEEFNGPVAPFPGEVPFGHTYGNATVDGSGVTIFGNVTHNYFVYGSAGQWELAGRTTSFEYEEAYPNRSNFDHPKPPSTPSCNQLLHNTNSYRLPPSGPFSIPQTLPWIPSPIRENESLMSAEKMQRQLPWLQPREQGNVQPERQPGNDTSTALASQQKLGGRAASRVCSQGTRVDKTLLFTVAHEEESWYEKPISNLKVDYRRNVVFAHSIRDAMPYLQRGNAVSTVIFSISTTSKAFLSALVDYTKSGGRTIITNTWCNIDKYVNGFFAEHCQLPWLYDGLWEYGEGFVRNPDCYLGLPDHLPRTYKWPSKLMRNVAREDLLYIGCKDMVDRKDARGRKSASEQLSGPFALTKLGEGSVGWFGVSLVIAELQPVLLFMLGMTD